MKISLSVWNLIRPLVLKQNAEVVDFSANGITATGVKALLQVLPTNTFLKTLNFSGNNIGDEGATVCGLFHVVNHHIIFDGSLYFLRQSQNVKAKLCFCFVGFKDEKLAMLIQST